MTFPESAIARNIARNGQAMRHSDLITQPSTPSSPNSPTHLCSLGAHHYTLGRDHSQRSIGCSQASHSRGGCVACSCAYTWLGCQILYAGGGSGGRGDDGGDDGEGAGGRTTHGQVMEFVDALRQDGPEDEERFHRRATLSNCANKIAWKLARVVLLRLLAPQSSFPRRCMLLIFLQRL